MTDFDLPMFDESSSQIFCAIALNKDGSYRDGIYNWETAETIASEGYQVIALTDDNSVTREEIQRLCDTRYNDYRDCFGVE